MWNFNSLNYDDARARIEEKMRRESQHRLHPFHELPSILQCLQQAIGMVSVVVRQNMTIRAICSRRYIGSEVEQQDLFYSA